MRSESFSAQIESYWGKFCVFKFLGSHLEKTGQGKKEVKGRVKEGYSVELTEKCRDLQDHWNRAE